MKTVLRTPFIEGNKAGILAVDKDIRTTGVERVADFQRADYIEGFKRGVKEALNRAQSEVKE